MAGRPTEYKTEYCTQVEKLCKILNPSLSGIAYFFSVSESAIIEWCNDYIEFSSAIRIGQESHSGYLEQKRRKREKRNTRLRQNVAKSPKLRIRNNIASQMHYHLKNKNGRHVFNLLGYSCENLMEHLEALFKPGMTWANYGKHWHVDHKIPASWFKYDKVESEEFQKCWALSNLQPLEASQNVKKNNRYASA